MLQHDEINTDASTEFALVQRIAAGDTACFEILIRRYNGVLYKIARTYGFNHQDAEDLMQETHVAAYMALASFEGRASYKTWISRIMVHKCLYKIKHGYYKKEVSETELPQTGNAFMNQRPTSDTLLQKELAAVLENSLQQIPPMYRTVFVLREVEGFSVAETADLLNISAVNVKVRLSRAKALLQKQVERTYSRPEIYSFNLVYCDAMVSKVFEKIAQLKKGTA